MQCFASVLVLHVTAILYYNPTPSSHWQSSPSYLNVNAARHTLRMCRKFLFFYVFWDEWSNRKMVSPTVPHFLSDELLARRERYDWLGEVSSCENFPFVVPPTEEKGFPRSSKFWKRHPTDERRHRPIRCLGSDRRQTRKMLRWEEFSLLKSNFGFLIAHEIKTDKPTTDLTRLVTTTWG